MKLIKITICVLLLIFLSCNNKQKNKEPFLVSDFIEANKNSTANELNIKLDSVLTNNKQLTNDKKGIIYFEKGKSHLKIYEDSKAAKSFINAIEQFKKSNNIEYEIKALINLSNTNIYLKNYVNANKQAIEALDLATENSKNTFIALANNILSRIYYLNNDYKKSFEYLNNSVALQIKEKDSINLSASYNNIAILYKNTNKPKKSIEYNNKALEISKRVNDSIGIGKAYSNLGRLYVTLNMPEKALSYYKKAITNNNDANIKNSIPYSNIGSLYQKQNQLDSAATCYLKASKIELLKNNASKLHDIYKDLFSIETIKGNYKNALAYQIKIDSLKLEITTQENKEKIKALENLQKLFESEKKISIAKRVNNKNRILFIATFAVLALISIILFQKNKNAKLKLSQEKLKLEQKVLRSQMNPHFIFNALSAIQNSLLENKPIKSASYLSKFAKLIRQNFDFINLNKITLSEEVDALRNYLDTQQMRFTNKFKYEINIYPNIDADIIKIPPLLLQPFVENSIEHAFKNLSTLGLITINIKREKKHICFEIIDNGKGYNINQKKDNKEHAIDIFKKRLKLLNNSDSDSLSITSNNNGTTIKFCLQE